MTKFSLEIPETLKDNLDYLANELDTTRSDAIREILETVMESEDFIDIIFGEALEEGDSETVDEEKGESEEEEEEEAESEE